MPFTVSVIDPPLRTYVVGTYESEGTAVDVASSGSLNVGGGESRVTEHVTGVVLAIFRRTIVAPEDWDRVWAAKDRLTLCGGTRYVKPPIQFTWNASYLSESLGRRWISVSTGKAHRYEAETAAVSAARHSAGLSFTPVRWKVEAHPTSESSRGCSAAEIEAARAQLISNLDGIEYPPAVTVRPPPAPVRQANAAADSANNLSRTIATAEMLRSPTPSPAPAPKKESPEESGAAKLTRISLLELD